MRHIEREETIGRVFREGPVRPQAEREGPGRQAASQRGGGAEAFARARRVLFDYTFYPPAIVSAPGPIVLGMVLHQRVRVGPLRFDGPVRVIELWDEPTRAGYRYEALPGHVERGIATFEVTLAGDEVRFRISSDSAMAHWLARLGAPFARMVQRRAIDGAFKRMRAAAGGDR